MQLRGSCLPLWLDMLPPTPDDVAQANLRTLAAALDHLGEPAHHSCMTDHDRREIHRG